MNISNTSWDLDKFNRNFNDLSSFLNKHKLDGVELILHEDEYLNEFTNDILHGLHLKYYPTWLEFYKGDKAKLEILFDNHKAIEACYGGLKPEFLINGYKNEYENAKKLGVKYMVFHVAHVTTEHAFTFDFDYDDDEVLDATVDLVNKAFDHDSDIELLFENLWWPGMTLLSKDKTKRFLERINYKNKGIMLDLSHMMITNPSIKDTKDATKYIIDRINDLGELKSYIKGIHVNKAIPGDYMDMDHSNAYEELKNITDSIDKYIKTIGHIKNMDWHVPYDCDSVREIVELVDPKYVVYEVLSENLEQLDEFLSIQNRAMGR